MCFYASTLPRSHVRHQEIIKELEGLSIMLLIFCVGGGKWRCFGFMSMRAVKVGIYELSWNCFMSVSAFQEDPEVFRWGLV